jgi:hypothetical protein
LDDPFAEALCDTTEARQQLLGFGCAEPLE